MPPKKRPVSPSGAATPKKGKKQKTTASTVPAGDAPVVEGDAGAPTAKGRQKKPTKYEQIDEEQLSNIDILKHAAASPTDCYVIVPDNQFYDSPYVLASYLGFSDGLTFRTWLNSKTVSAITQGYIDAIKGNASRNTLNATWTTIEQNNKVYVLTETEAKYPTTQEQTDKCEVQFYIGLTIAAMAKLVSAMPAPESQAKRHSESNWTGFHKTRCTSEDLHRAFHVLKFVERQSTKGDQKKNFLKSTTNVPAIPVKFLTPEQVERAQHGQAAPTEQTEVVERVVENLYNLSSDMEAPGDSEGSDARVIHQVKEDWNRICDRAFVMEGRSDRKDTTGFVLERDPMTAGQQRALCNWMGKQVTVEYDHMTLGSQHASDDTAIGKAQDMEDPDREPDVETDEGRERFWNLMAKVAGVSSQPPEFLDACSFLNINAESCRWPYGAPEDTDAEDLLKLMTWQVQGAAWIVQQEQGPLHSYLLADACGIGKTIQVLASITFSAKKEEERIKSGVVTNARPTLILSPSNCVEVWTDEITKWFPSIRARRYYEAPDKVPAHLAPITLQPGLSALKAYVAKHCAGDDPATPWTVIVSSYETITSRCFEEVTTDSATTGPGKTIPLIGEEEQPTEMQNREYTCLIPGMFSRVICDEGHKAKNPQTTFSRFIKLLRCDKIGVLTATPFMNKVIDGLGYLILFWRDDMGLHEDEEIAGTVAEYYDDDDFRPQHTPAYMDGGRYDLAKYNQRFWRLKPTSFKSVASRDGDQALYLIRQVLTKLIPLVMLRRTQASMVYFNGDKVRIGESIPPYKICTVELGFSHKGYEEAYFKQFQKLYKRLNLASQKGGFRQYASMQVDSAGGRDFGIHRMLSILTFHPGLFDFIRKASASTPQEIEKWTQKTIDRGLSYYFQLTRPRRDLPPYVDRYSFAMYLCKESPKMMYLVSLLGKMCLDQKERVLVYVDYPVSQWFVISVLKMIGFKVVSLTSDMSAGERIASVSQFNDPQSNVDVMVCALKVSSFGLNLQVCCSRLIIMAIAENLNTIIQVIGRIHRLNAYGPGEVYIMSLIKSYDNILQFHLGQKYLKEMAGEAHFDDAEVARILRAENVGAEEHYADGRVMEDADLALAQKQQRAGAEIKDLCGNLITRLLGQRSSRLDGDLWDNPKDLSLPWEQQPEAEPELQQPVPVRSLKFDVFGEKRVTKRKAPPTRSIDPVAEGTTVVNVDLPRVDNQLEDARLLEESLTDAERQKHTAIEEVLRVALAEGQITLPEEMVTDAATSTIAAGFVKGGFSADGFAVEQISLSDYVPAATGSIDLVLQGRTVPEVSTNKEPVGQTTLTDAEYERRYEKMKELVHAGLEQQDWDWTTQSIVEAQQAAYAIADQMVEAGVVPEEWEASRLDLDLGPWPCTPEEIEALANAGAFSVQDVPDLADVAGEATPEADGEGEPPQEADAAAKAAQEKKEAAAAKAAKAKQEKKEAAAAKAAKAKQEKQDKKDADKKAKQEKKDAEKKKAEKKEKVAKKKKAAAEEDDAPEDDVPKDTSRRRSGRGK